MIKETTLNFLKTLQQHNNRDWFANNKDQYDDAKLDFELFAQQIIEGLGSFEPELLSLDVKKCIFRIYRDTRFSKDKTPYKNHFGAVFTLPGLSKSSGYYFHLSPGESFMSGGHYMLPPDQLKIIREHIYDDVDNFESFLNQADFKSWFGKLQTDNQLKRVPTGYDKDHPAAEYLKLKSFYVLKKIDDQQVLQPSLIDELIDGYKVLHGFQKYLNSILLQS